MTETDRCFKILMLKPQNSHHLPNTSRWRAAGPHSAPSRPGLGAGAVPSPGLGGGQGAGAIKGRPLGGEELVTSRLRVAVVRRRGATTVSRKGRRLCRPPRRALDKHAHVHMLATPQDSRPSSPQPPSSSLPACSDSSRKVPSREGPPWVSDCVPARPRQPHRPPEPPPGSRPPHPLRSSAQGKSPRWPRPPPVSGPAPVPQRAGAGRSSSSGGKTVPPPPPPPSPASARLG